MDRLYGLHLSDEELCSLAANGAREAEEVLAERYVSLVRSCARPYFLAGGSSEDLTSEGMIGLLTAIRAYRPERGARFRSFAETCIRSRIFSSLRAAGRSKNLPLNTYVSIDPLSFDAATVPSPEQELLDRERIAELFGELPKLLSEFENKVLRLYLDGLSGSEIASRLSREPKSIENAVGRVRRKLTRYLSDETQADPGDPAPQPKNRR